MTSSDIDADLNTAEEEGLLTRWSRRKHEARTSRVEQKTIEERLLTTAVQDEPEEPEEILLEDSDMPALETLNQDSDYSGFMSSKVSDSLRTLALRQLFRGSMFNVRDGLDDYDDDFTQFTKLGDVVTAEMRRQIARLNEADGEGQGEEVIDEEVSQGSSDSETDSTGLSTADASDAAGKAGSADEGEETLGQQGIENLEITAKKDSGE